MCHWNFKSLSNDQELSRIDLRSVIFVRQKRVFLLFIYLFIYLFFIVTAVSKKQGKRETLITLSQNLVKYGKVILGCWDFHFSLQKNLDSHKLLFDESYPGFLVFHDNRCILIKHVIYRFSQLAKIARRNSFLFCQCLHT